MRPALFYCAVLTAILFGGWAGSVVAAEPPPGILSHQGRIAVNGVNHDGPGHFKFALVNPAGDTSHWSNDGTSTIGDQPTAAVTDTVSKGHYSVLLGDSPMLAIPASVFTDQADVRLRIWFSADGTTFEQLTPDRRIAAVGYALSAGAVSTIADDVVSAAKIQNNAVTSIKIAANSINAGKIADGSITMADLSFAVGDITGVTAGAGLSGGGDVGALTLSIADEGVTSAHVATDTLTASDLAAGAVGSSEIADGAIAAADLDPGIGVWSAPVGDFLVTTKAIQFGSSTATAAAGNAGAIRYSAGDFQGSDGSNWRSLTEPPVIYWVGGPSVHNTTQSTYVPLTLDIVVTNTAASHFTVNANGDVTFLKAGIYEVKLAAMRGLNGGSSMRSQFTKDGTVIRHSAEVGAVGIVNDRIQILQGFQAGEVLRAELILYGSGTNWYLYNPVLGDGSLLQIRYLGPLPPP